MSRIVLIVLMSLSLNQLSGQDIRYSQFFNNPLAINPALTGSGIEHLRATISYRRQEAGPGNPFATKGASIDKIIGKWGLGFNIHSNGAGDASIKSLNLAGSLSYRLFFGYKSSHELAAGLQIGLLSRSINPAKFTFDNQFTQDVGYDPSIASGETFENNSIIRPTINSGIQWKYKGRKKSTKVRPYLGYATFHLNQPDVSFFGDDVRYNMKHTIQGGADINVSEGLLIKPSILHSKHGPFNETVFGVLGSYQHGAKNQIQAGIFGKAQKAFVFYAGYQIDRFLVGMSYDVASGPINEAGKGYNAFELSLTFTPKAKEKPIKTDKEILNQKDSERKTGATNKQVEKNQKSTEKQKPTTVLADKKDTRDSLTQPTTYPVSAIQEQTEKTETTNSDTPAANTESNEIATSPVPHSEQPIVKSGTEILPVDASINNVASITADTKPSLNENNITKPVAETNVPTIDVSTKSIVQENNQAEFVTANSQQIIEPSKQPDPVSPMVSNPIEVAAAVSTDRLTHSSETNSQAPSKPAFDQPEIATQTTTSSEHKSPEATVAVTNVPSVFSPIVPNNKIVARDSDQDGVNDFEDPCPFIKGTLATRGCPDTDEDGLVDMVDFCPLESGPKTNGGCPVLTARTSKDQQIVSGFDHVLFNTGSVTLTIDNTYDIIERAVDYLYFDKSTYVLISGHTDAEGDPASNMELSQKRADKVKSYFIGQGITEGRIKTIPYGENMPISGNSTETSRKLNRRVEITILKKGE